MKCVRPCCRKEIPDGASFCPWCGKKQPEAAPQQRKKRRRPKGSGTVYKRKDGVRNKPYTAVVPGENGKKTSLGSFATSGEAIQALDTYNAQRTPAYRLKYTFSDVYERWSASHFEGLGEKGRDDYIRAYQKSTQLYDIQMRNLKQDDYQNIINGLVAEGKSRSACEKQQHLFSQMCKWAMVQDIISQNYAASLKLPPAPKKKERILSGDEIEMIQEIAYNHAKNNRFRKIAEICLVLVYTGVRIDELLKLRRDDVFLDKNYMIGGEKSDAGRGRIIPILDPIKNVIAGWMLDSIGCEWLLPSTNGRKKDVNTVEHSFQNFMLHCKINTAETDPKKKVTPHTLRRTATTKLARGKADPTAVKEIIGHSDFSTTANYYIIQDDPEYLLQEMQRMKK